MNLILVSPDEVVGARVVLAGCRRAHHILHHLRPGVGDSLRVGVFRRGHGRCRVVEKGPSTVVLEFDGSLEPATRPGTDLIIAMPRPKALSRMLQHAAAMGVGRIDIVNAWKVDRSYLSSRRLNDDHLRADLGLGCEQGAHSWLPHIEVHRLLMPFLNERLGEAEPRLKLVAHPRNSQPLEVVYDSSTRRVVAVGPDGGWTDQELETLCRLGFSPVSLSARVMRSEAAITAALAQLELLGRSIKR